MFEERKDKNIIGTAVYDPKYQREKSIEHCKHLLYEEKISPFDDLLVDGECILKDIHICIVRNFQNRKGYNDCSILFKTSITSAYLCKDDRAYCLYKNKLTEKNILTSLDLADISTCFVVYYEDKKSNLREQVKFISGDIEYCISFKCESEGNE